MNNIEWMSIPQDRLKHKMILNVLVLHEACFSVFNVIIKTTSSKIICSWKYIILNKDKNRWPRPLKQDHSHSQTAEWTGGIHSY